VRHLANCFRAKIHQGSAAVRFALHTHQALAGGICDEKGLRKLRLKKVEFAHLWKSLDNAFTLNNLAFNSF
jgi:hypothetical protein